MINEKTLNHAKYENLLRFSKWMQVLKSPKEYRNKTLFIYAILRQVKKFKNYPKGTIPSEMQKEK